MYTTRVRFLHVYAFYVCILRVYAFYVCKLVYDFYVCTLVYARRSVRITLTLFWAPPNQFLNNFYYKIKRFRSALRAEKSILPS